MISDKKAIAIDLETIPDESVFPLLKEPKPDGRIKDPDKIRADIEKKKSDEIDKLGMKPNKNLIVCAGWFDGEASGSFFLPSNSTGLPSNFDDNKFHDESSLISAFWSKIADYDYFITFNGIAFDIPTLNIHSIRHKIRPSVKIDCQKYRITNHLDLYQVLSHWNPMMGGGLDFYLRYFGISSGKDGMSGDQVADYYRMGDMGEKVIRQYCESDCIGTWKLAERVNKYMIL